MQEMNK